MGIKGLHKALSFCTVKDNLENYRGQRVAIDTSSWLHKSVYSFSEKFVESTDRGLVDSDCVHRAARYIHSRCKELLTSFGIKTIYLVMDGERCPLKADETHDREQKRQENLDEARRLKAQGQQYQAEEKYKSCIRVRADFTKEVMSAVEKHFHQEKEKRVVVIWSPYEADAQLTKLCIDKLADVVITEDSDVLVYSAAAHVVFPVLFKLDRHSGTCDSISMDFLLSMKPEDEDKVVKSNNNFECIMQNFAVRQSKRKGFGVRLFVQGCVLGGCDYSINTLEGVGLVNAFKLVRDNAYRNDNVRFQKILQSLPSKVKKKMNVEDYEERLAKSEAVFFYHYVKHIGGDVKPLLTPRISGEDDVEDRERTQHFPFLQRFNNNWAFLGERSSSQHQDPIIGKDSSLKETSVVESIKHKPKTILPIQSSKAKSVFNPYSRAKRGNQRRPLEERKGNVPSDENKSEAFPHHRGKSTKHDFNIFKYLQDMPDPRYAKRKFLVARAHSRSSSRSNGTSRYFRHEILTKDEEPTTQRTAHPQSLSNPFYRFQYRTSSPCEDGDKNLDRPTNPLTQEKNVLDEQDESLCAKGQTIYTPFHGTLNPSAPTEMSLPSEEQPMPTDITKSDEKQSASTENSAWQEKDGRELVNEHHKVGEDAVSMSMVDFHPDSPRRKYFNKSDEARRVTLDSEVSTLDVPAKEDVWEDAETPCRIFSTEDVVDSPEYRSPEQPNDIPGFFPLAKKASLGKSRKPSISKDPGPLLAGFKRQQEFFNQINDLGLTEAQTFAYSSAQKPKRLRDLTSYFQPAVKTTRPHFFNQLPMNTNQSDEDFLWNG
ncbi:XPG domain containing protein [Nitzschia inconspicua]|uniref:XPG domain containing protein n=1 Tax=Nitzschia inconspicua TaxID=303405 RepID=A0A9K3LMZ2_9STRA|nr:XPG domain containing protein [Nitzschia inconspicua]